METEYRLRQFQGDEGVFIVIESKLTARSIVLQHSLWHLCNIARVDFKDCPRSSRSLNLVHHALVNLAFGGRLTAEFDSLSTSLVCAIAATMTFKSISRRMRPETSFLADIDPSIGNCKR